MFRKTVALKKPHRVLRNVLTGLLDEEKKVLVKPNTRVALGFGTCMDCVVPGLPLIKSLGIDAPTRSQHHNHIENEEQFRQVFAHFFKHGAAAERHIPSKRLFKRLVDGANNIPEARWSLGGNAPTMAQRFATDGCEVLLGARMSIHAQKYLHRNIRVTGSPPEEDEVHLVLEYSSGSEFGSYTTPRFNRFIAHSDTSNAFLESLEVFVDELNTFSPDLLVIGGLQMMDNFPFVAGERSARLRKLQKMLLSVPKSTLVHFEMASFAEKELIDDLLKYVIPYVDSLGMNEQELPNLYSELKYGNVSLISDPIPRVATVLDTMRDIYEILSNRSEENGHIPLTRLHVHTLAFQAILCEKSSPWKDSASAAAAASLAASRWISGDSNIDIRNTYLLMNDSFTVSNKPGSRRIPFEAEAPLSCWDEENLEMCVAPMLVCSRVLQTGGAGDNISAAGLAPQV